MASSLWTAAWAGEQVPVLVMDKRYSNGFWSPDRFAGSHLDDFRGRKVLRLDNGDVVVAGMVPPYLGGNPANGLWNIGLVRYNASGQRVSWGGDSAFHFFNGQYVVWPNSATPSHRQVSDITLLNDRILVLVEHEDTSVDSWVVAFDLDGNYVSHGFALDSSNRDETPAGMAVYSQALPAGGVSHKVVVVGTAAQSATVSTPVYARMTLHPDGTLTRDTDIGNQDGYVYIPVSSQFCEGSQACRAQASSVTVVRNPALPDWTPRRVFIGGSVMGFGSWDYLAVGISDHGEPIPGFGFNGVVVIPIDQGGSNNDMARSIEASMRLLPNDLTETSVFLTGEVAMADQTNKAIVKLRGSGLLDNTFAMGGRLIGHLTCGTAPCTGNPRILIGDTLLDGSSLMIASTFAWDAGHPSCQTYGACVIPEVTELSTTSGWILAHGQLPQFRPDFSNYGDAAVYGIAAAGSGRYVLAGDGREASTGNRLWYITAGVVHDQVFQDGFQGL